MTMLQNMFSLSLLSHVLIWISRSLNLLDQNFFCSKAKNVQIITKLSQSDWFCLLSNFSTVNLSLSQGRIKNIVLFYLSNRKYKRGILRYSSFITQCFSLKSWTFRIVYIALLGFLTEVSLITEGSVLGPGDVTIVYY